VGGLISGTGATPRSGRVRVFARRTVAPERWGSRAVGMGTSETLGFTWKRRAIAERIVGACGCSYKELEREAGLLLNRRIAEG
jgi:hypothetical protein